MTTNPSPGALDLGRAWNLLADAMHALDALDTPGRSNQMRKDLIHAKIEEAHGIVQRSLAPGAVPDPKHKPFCRKGHFSTPDCDCAKPTQPGEQIA